MLSKLAKTPLDSVGVILVGVPEELPKVTDRLRLIWEAGMVIALI
jgi:hypothetical protein